MATTFEVIRAEALFVSPLQASQRPTRDKVRQAIVITLRQRGIRGCAGTVAEEFGDHPDTAVPRMTWALATVRAVFPAAPAHVAAAVAA